VVNDQIPDDNHLAGETRQALRGKRRTKEKAKVPQHGKSLTRVYRDAVSKRAREAEAGKKSD